MTNKTKESLNKFLAEWLKEKFHIFKWNHDKNFPLPIEQSHGGYYVCSCGKTFSSWSEEYKNHKNTDYTTDTGFWILWRAAKKSEEREKFITYLIKDENGIWLPFKSPRDIARTSIDLVDPPVFAETWAKFLGWKEDK